MYAARILPDAHDLSFGEVDTPVPVPGWALVEVKAAGLCHTDLHVMAGAQFSARNTVDYSMQRPLILGHEVAGIVSAVGDDADVGWVGRRVAVASGGRKRSTPGMHMDGGFAQFCTVPTITLVEVPAEVTLDAAAVATDSIATAYSAVHKGAGITAADRVGVIGLGGLGLSAVRIASLAGATVFGIDIDPDRFGLARAAGAERCVTDIEELADDHISAVIDFVGGATTAAALDAVDVDGRVVLVGLSASELTVSGTSLVLGRKALIGSLGSGIGVVAEVLRLIANGDIVPLTEVVPFDGLNSSYDRLRAGTVAGRLVTHPNG